ncbi:MAG: hypothetical protein ACLQHK_06530 [Gallionellaceae bacterium]
MDKTARLDGYPYHQVLFCTSMANEYADDRIERADIMDIQFQPNLQNCPA